MYQILTKYRPIRANKIKKMSKLTVFIKQFHQQLLLLLSWYNIYALSKQIIWLFSCLRAWLSSYVFFQPLIITKIFCLKPCEIESPFQPYVQFHPTYFIWLLCSSLAWYGAESNYKLESEHRTTAGFIIRRHVCQYELIFLLDCVL